MSKIGFKPITIPQGVQVEIAGPVVTVKGMKGTLSYNLPDFLSVSKENDVMLVTRQNDSKRQKATHGLYRSLIANGVHGVTEGWSRKLEVVGTGFNAKMQGKGVVLKVGYSHPVTYEPQDGIQLAVDGNNVIIITGADKQLVGQVAHQIKLIRKPDIYKGKGIRFEGERVRIKPGKKTKA